MFINDNDETMSETTITHTQCPESTKSSPSQAKQAHEQNFVH